MVCGSRTWNGQTALTLEEGGICLDELVRGDIANGDTTGHFGDCSECRWAVGENVLRGSTSLVGELFEFEFACVAAKRFAGCRKPNSTTSVHVALSQRRLVFLTFDLLQRITLILASSHRLLRFR